MNISYKYKMPIIKSKQKNKTKSLKIDNKNQSYNCCSLKYCIYIVVILIISILYGIAVLYVMDSSMHLPIKKLEQSSEPISNPTVIPLQSSIDPLESVNERCPYREPNLDKQPLLPNKKKKGSTDMHFIHMPKCGGTSMTAVLREIVCAMDSERNTDCCTNPGFCDWHAFRRCESMRGCTNHFPQRDWIFKPPPSITIFREPTSRILSAWFYRGHSPNLDFFQVRPEFKEIEKGIRPKVKFDEYIEMIEYQNIQTRMLGADSFPYRNVTINEDVFCLAVEALDNIFFVGLLEAYDISIEMLLREFNMSNLTITITKERDQNNRRTNEEKKKLLNNKNLMNRFKELNHYDYDLYNLAVKKFCYNIKKYPDLYEKLQHTTKVKCN